MQRLLRWLRTEIIEVLPAVLFFLTAFILMHWIETLFVEGSGVRMESLVKAAIGALIVGKVLLVVDLLPVVNAFRDRPLILDTLWKTLLYTTAAFLFRVGEELLPLAVETGSLASGSERYLAQVHWPRFWAIHLFLTMMLFIFVAAREFVVAVGTERARRMFFGG